jgi:cation diffusion facilitator family transporter
MAAHGKGDARELMLAALAGTAAIAIAKLVAAGLSGSVTMMAASVHSIADTTNRAMLLLARWKPENVDRQPLGLARESYFWAFMLALMLFFLGGWIAISEGIRSLAEPHSEPGSQLLPLLVIVLSLGFEAASFWVAARQLRKTRGEQSLKDALFGGMDPTIPIVLLESTGKMLSLIVALIAVITTWLSGSRVSDSVGSIVIGVLLCAIGLSLAHDTRSLMLGGSAHAEMRRKAAELACSVEGVQEVTQSVTVQLGSGTSLLALQIRLSADLPVERAQQVIDAIEARVQSEMPEVKRILIEPEDDWSPQSKRA